MLAAAELMVTEWASAEDQRLEMAGERSHFLDEVKAHLYPVVRTEEPVVEAPPKGSTNVTDLAAWVQMANRKMG